MAVASGLIAGAAGAAGAVGAQPQTIAAHAAGSLRAPLTQAAQAFEQAHPGTRIALSFGAPGLGGEEGASAVSFRREFNGPAAGRGFP